jgi:asparagine synthase (glutamine-hydrolysing)
MFDEHFPPSCASTVMRWTPKWSKQTDPSGRLVKSPAEGREVVADVVLNRAISTHQAKYDNAG